MAAAILDFSAALASQPVACDWTAARLFPLVRHGRPRLACEWHRDARGRLVCDWHQNPGDGPDTG